MSYFDKNKKVRLRLSMDPKERFPEKLFEVANDDFLIKWDGSGESVIVNPEYFEDNVMKCYPGFLQISTFLNLRRLFREYGFEWRINSDETFEFSHEFFVRDQPHLLGEIVTRRKSFYRPSPRAFTPPQTPTPLGKRRSSLRRSALTLRHRQREITSPKVMLNVDDNDVALAQTTEQSTLDTSIPKLHPVGKLDPALLHQYARNELTEEEILLLLGRQNGILSRVAQPNVNTGPGKGFEWMYLFCDSDNTWPDCDNQRIDIVDNCGTSHPNPDSNLVQLLPATTVPCCPCRCHYGL